MALRLLASHLHETAKAAKAFFRTDLGATHIQEEEEVSSLLSLRPTLSGKLSDGYLLCAEVSERPYSNSLDSFVLECVRILYPVKLFVVVPSRQNSEFSADLRKAKERGVGVVEVPDEGKPFLFNSPVPLSLFGLTRTLLQEFPKAKREAVKNAEETFLSGFPVQGCQSIYQELEAITRAFAKRTHAEGWWRAPHAGEAGPPGDFDSAAWATLLDGLLRLLVHTKTSPCIAKCPEISTTLIASARGTTDPRNLTSHRPGAAARTNRDRQLRNWFESSSELYKKWCNAVKPLKI